MIKYIFFDVSATLLGKPVLFTTIQNTLKDHNYYVSLDDIKHKHKLLSEVIHFPDRTDQEFYKKFNLNLLYLLGIVPTAGLLDAVFKNCTYLPWEKFEDTSVLTELGVPLGIISNFNTTLKDKLNFFFGDIFQDIFVSEELGVAKPSVEFYKRALEKIPFTAEEVLYIGDSIKLDMEPATSLGIETLIIDRDNFYPNLEKRISSLNEIKNYL
jgi:putative hydrolase of the HAD superfamily